MATTTQDTSGRQAEPEPAVAIGTDLPKSLSFINLQQNAQRAGSLMKYEKGFFKRILGRTWQWKYCILSGYHFYWFKNKKGSEREKSNGVINLRYFDRCAIPTDKHANIPHAFELASSQSTDNRQSFLFQADSVEEQQRWLKDIQLVIFQCQTQGRTGSVQRAGTRPSSRTTSPVLHRHAEDDRRPRSSSIPEAGTSGIYRSVGQPTDQQTADESDVFPPEAAVSRSESRNTKPDLIPRMPTYNQVVTELQSRLHSRSDESQEHSSSHHHQTVTRLSSAHTSPLSPTSPSPLDGTTSPSLSPDATSGSSSVSSYDNTEQQPTPSSVQSVSSPTAASIEARFDSVLKMMEDLTDEENIGGPRSAIGGPEYAMPYRKQDHNGPAVAPKPNREMYESLLSNNVGPYLVSPIVNVSG